jgi:hypothetical protein
VRCWSGSSKYRIDYIFVRPADTIQTPVDVGLSEDWLAHSDRAPNGGGPSATAGDDRYELIAQQDFLHLRTTIL